MNDEATELCMQLLQRLLQKPLQKEAELNRVQAQTFRGMI